MDKIYINDLEIFAYHGVLADEKINGQNFIISIELGVSLREAGYSDKLDETVNYADVCDSVEKVFTARKYDLIEKCAEVIAEHILLTYQQVETVSVTIKKPHAPIKRKFGYVAVEIKRSWHIACIGIGSNLGDKRENIMKSIQNISSNSTQVLNISQMYETEPVGYKEQDDFINCALKIRTLLKPQELLEMLLNIENGLMRERTIKWGPRTIDIDILLYDKLIMADHDLTIPHPRMHERLFVLDPMCDIEPNAIHPVLGKRMIELRDELKL